LLTGLRDSMPHIPAMPDDSSAHQGRIHAPQLATA
jgi:hypothetical protein